MRHHTPRARAKNNAHMIFAGGGGGGVCAQEKNDAHVILLENLKKFSSQIYKISESEKAGLCLLGSSLALLCRVLFKSLAASPDQPR